MGYSTQHTVCQPPLSFSIRVCSNSSPLSWWHYKTISFSDTSFFCLQSFPSLGSFPMSQLFASGCQSIVASASAIVIPMNIKGWFLLGLTRLISLLSEGFSRISSNTVVQKHQLFTSQPSLWSNSHINIGWLEKP